MRTFVGVTLALLLAAPIAGAQTSPFDGKWSGQMVSAMGKPIRVDLTVAGATGHLRLSPAAEAVNSGNPDTCHLRDIPVSIESKTDTDLNFVVRGDKAMIGCFSGAGAVKLVDPKNATGTLKDGRTFKLSRK